MDQNQTPHSITQELEQRRRVAESLRETLRIINSNRPVSEILDHIVRQAKVLTGAAACVIYGIDRETQTGNIAAYDSTLHGLATPITFDLDSVPGRELTHIILQPGASYTNFTQEVRAHTRNDPELDEEMRARRLAVLEHFAGSLAAPLFVRGEAYGALLYYYDAPQPFSDEQIGIASTFAEQAALAIENARIHRAEHERRRVAESLREGLTVLNSNQPLDELLTFIVSQAVELLGTSAGALYLLDSDEAMLRVGASKGLDADYVALQIPVGGAITGRSVAQGKPVSVPDLQASRGLLEEYLRAPDMPPGWLDALDWLTATYRAVLAVPVMTRDTIYGSLTLYYDGPQQFSDESIELAAAFGGQAALVIENTRLREQVEETAALAERNRLARELHDAVTQTLFSANLIAETLPDLWEIDAEDAQQRLKQLGKLTRGALAEMRTLLLELRPVGLADARMSVLLQQLVDAVAGRSKLNVSLNLQGHCALSPDVKLAFYRITQEALNNIVKHARAQNIFVSLRCLEDKVTLQILDDGCGFDPKAIDAGHFGISIMEERAASIGATFVIDTQPGEGAEITVFWTAW